VDRQLGLQLTNAAPGGDQLGLLDRGQARQLAGVDQGPFAPQVDRLLADLQIRSDLGDAATRLEQIENLPAKLRWIAPWHARPLSRVIDT
jgi:hypothetical protein